MRIILVCAILSKVERPTKHLNRENDFPPFWTGDKDVELLVVGGGRAVRGVILAPESDDRIDQ